MPNKQHPTEHRFRLELIAAMRTAFLKACEAPQVKDAGHGMTGIVAEKILELAEAREDQCGPSLYWRVAQVIAVACSVYMVRRPGP
jgi:hypothetical protein